MIRLHQNRVKTIALLDEHIRALRKEGDAYLHVKVQVFNGESDELMATFDTRQKSPYWEVEE